MRGAEARSSHPKGAWRRRAPTPPIVLRSSPKPPARRRVSACPRRPVCRSSPMCPPVTTETPAGPTPARTTSRSIAATRSRAAVNRTTQYLQAGASVERRGAAPADAQARPATAWMAPVTAPHSGRGRSWPISPSSYIRPPGTSLAVARPAAAGMSGSWDPWMTSVGTRRLGSAARRLPDAQIAAMYRRRRQPCRAGRTARRSVARGRRAAASCAGPEPAGAAGASRDYVPVVHPDDLKSLCAQHVAEPVGPVHQLRADPIKRTRGSPSASRVRSRTPTCPGRSVVKKRENRRNAPWPAPRIGALS